MRQLLRWSESLSAIARTGLGFSDNLYERERFEEVLQVAADIGAAVGSGAEGVDDAEGLVEEWMRPGRRGHRRVRHAQGRGRAPWSATTRARCSSCKGRTRVSGSTRPDGPTSATPPPRSSSKRCSRRPGSRPSPFG